MCFMSFTTLFILDPSFPANQLGLVCFQCPPALQMESDVYDVKSFDPSC